LTYTKNFTPIRPQLSDSLSYPVHKQINQQINNMIALSSGITGLQFVLQ